MSVDFLLDVVELSREDVEEDPWLDVLVDLRLVELLLLVVDFRWDWAWTVVFP